MNLLHTADLHIGMSNYSKLDPETGLDSRLMDFLNTFDKMVDFAIKNQVDAFLFAGDAYKTRDPSPTQQRGFGERIKKLAKAGIPVILVIGNHDTPNAEGKANTLDIYSALEIDNVYVSRKVETLNIPTKSGNLQIVTAPWLHKADLKTIGDKLLSCYESLKSNAPAVLVGHLEVEGSSFGSEKGLCIGNDVTVPLSLLTDKRLSYVALGHIHKCQVLYNPPTGGPPVIYCGSPERIDFGEEKEDKSFTLVEIGEPNNSHSEPGSKSKKRSQNEFGMTMNVSYKFIPTEARKFLTIKVALKEDDSDPTQTILNEIKKENLEGAIVRVIIDVPSGLSKEIEMDKIKKALSSAHVIAGISRNIEKSNRVKIEGADEVERLSPIEALKKYFESKNFDKEKIKNLEDYAKQILET